MNENGTKRIICVVGTRPEAIKMAPVILELQRQPWCELTVVGTGQHREMTRQALGIFNLDVDIDLDVMVANQRLSGLSAKILGAFDDILKCERPELVLVQGDTTTVMAVSLSCFHAHVPLAHVEAGLRTSNLQNPFPEEFNRRIATLATCLHFAPTQGAKRNLLAESVDPATIFVTGNTVIDSLLSVAPDSTVPEKGRSILVTMHRRENFDEPMARICDAICDLHDRHRDLTFDIPVHPNPIVKSLVYSKLQRLARVNLMPPVPYDVLASLMQKCTLILTDSGGIQEEAPALKKPVLVLRSETERPEAVDAGVAKLVGTDRALIVSEVDRLLSSPVYYARMASGASPYGDGMAAQRIAGHCADFLGLDGVVRPPEFDASSVEPTLSSIRERAHESSLLHRDRLALS